MQGQYHILRKDLLINFYIIFTFVKAVVLSIYFIFSQSTGQDEAILGEIKKATQSMSKNSVEQTAYFRALGAQNNLNMDKFHQQVQDELKAEGTEGKKGIMIFILQSSPWIIFSVHFVPCLNFTE